MILSIAVFMCTLVIWADQCTQLLDSEVLLLKISVHTGVILYQCAHMMRCLYLESAAGSVCQSSFVICVEARVVVERFRLAELNAFEDRGILLA